VNVAIIGASSDRTKFGNKAVRAYLCQGHTVYPVNLHQDRIEGLETRRSVEDVTVELDAILVYLQPATTLEVLPGIARKGATTVFLNPGSENAEVIRRAGELGIEPVLACSIIAIGETPGRYPA
jgi:predicted CoA-binding protein